MREPVAVFFTDLNLAIDQWQSGAVWDELQQGSRAAVVPGAPVVVTDDDDAYEATVTEVTSVGPHLVIHWDRRAKTSHKTPQAARA